MDIYFKITFLFKIPANLNKRLKVFEMDILFIVVEVN